MIWGRLRTRLADVATVGNGVMGACSILTTYLHMYLYTGAHLLAAMLLDGIDGYLARRLGTAHTYGRYLDTGADIVSFGVAPGFLLYTVITDMDGTLFLAALVSGVVYTSFAVTRLLIYVLRGYRLTVFRGLPSPAGALMVMMLVFLFGPTPYFFRWPLGTGGAMVVLSPLMVAPVAYPRVNGAWVRPSIVLCLVAGTAGISSYLLTFSYHTLPTQAAAAVAFVFMAGYALSGPALALRERTRGRCADAPLPAEREG